MDRYPQGEIVGQSDQAPFFYAEMKAGIVVVAGNVEPEQILGVMAANGWKKLGIVGHADIGEDGWEDQLYDELFGVTTLSFSDRAMEVIGRMLGVQARSTDHSR